MAEECLNVCFHFETIEAIEDFIAEAEVSFPEMKILARGGTPGQGLNCMWLDILLPAENPSRKPPLDSRTKTAEKKKESCAAREFFRRSRNSKGRDSA